MDRIVRRMALVVAATGAMSVSGSGLAIAGPTLSPDDREEGTIAVGSNPSQENWNCALVGSATGSGPRVDLAGVGESRGGFAPASTVVAVCLGSQAPVLATATGVSSLDDAD